MTAESSGAGNAVTVAVSGAESSIAAYRTLTATQIRDNFVYKLSPKRLILLVQLGGFEPPTS
jgi:hypothetical protein